MQIREIVDSIATGMMSVFRAEKSRIEVTQGSS